MFAVLEGAFLPDARRMNVDGGTLLVVGLLVYLVAGGVKGLIGIGLPTMAVGLSAQLVGAREAIALAIVPMLVANAWQVTRSGDPREVVRRVWRGYRVLVSSMLLSIGVVALLAPAVSVELVTLGLGLVMTLFALVSLWREPPPLPDRFDTGAQLLCGAVSGLLGGITGIWAPPIIVYLGARRLGKDAFVETVGVLLFAGSAVLLAGYLVSGIVSPATAARSLVLILPALAGFALGERLRRQVSGTRFRTLVLGFFLIMGLNLVRRALGGAA